MAPIVSDAMPLPPLPAVYQEIKTFSDLTHVNIAFLEGKLSRSPYYCEPVYTVGHPLRLTEDVLDYTMHMMQFLPEKDRLELAMRGSDNITSGYAAVYSYALDLIQLNRFGFYTMDSQPSAGTGPCTQRSYLCGMLPTSVADALVAYLLEHHNKGRYHTEYTEPDGTQKGCYLYDADSVFFAKINLKPSDRQEASLLPYDAQHKDIGETERYYARKRGTVFSKTLEAWEKRNESAYDTYHDTCSMGIDSHGSFCMRWITQTADEYLEFHPPHVVDLLKENYAYIVIISQLETGIAVEKLLLDFYASHS